MDSLARLCDLLQHFLMRRPKELERLTGFVQRSTARLDGPRFVQMCVLGWMHEADASYSQLNHAVASLGLHVRNQAIEARFGVASAALMRQLLEEAAGHLLEGQAVQTPLLQHFPGGVFLQDGSVISLPDELTTSWQGCGGGPGASRSAVRIQARWEMWRGGLHGLWLQPASQSERQGGPVHQPFPEHSLRIVDTAYLTYSDMRAESQAGRCWITGVKANMVFVDGQGRCWNLTEWLHSQPAQQRVVDGWVRVGQSEQISVRLIALRLPKDVVYRRKQRANCLVEGRPHRKGVQQLGRRPKPQAGRRSSRRVRKHHRVSASKQKQLDWLLVLTNVAGSLLSSEQVVALLRLRWQIELFWKLCKQEGQIDRWRSSKPQRILTELYAKLLGLLMEHWITLQGCWHDPRRSLFKARQVIEWTVPWLVLALREQVTWQVIVAAMCEALGSNCWTDRRRKPPSTFQQLADPKLCSS